MGIYSYLIGFGIGGMMGLMILTYVEGKTLNTKILVGISVASIIVGTWGISFAEYDPGLEEVYVNVVVTESANQPFRGKIAVAEVLRDRGWDYSGFAGIKRRDLRDFLSRESKATFKEAGWAVHLAREGSSIAKGAFYFENLEAFPIPAWFQREKVTVKIADQTFWRK